VYGPPPDARPYLRRRQLIRFASLALILAANTGDSARESAEASRLSANPEQKPQVSAVKKP